MDREIKQLNGTISALEGRLELARTAHYRAYGQRVFPHGVKPQLRRNPASVASPAARMYHTGELTLRTPAKSATEAVNEDHLSPPDDDVDDRDADGGRGASTAHAGFAPQSPHTLAHTHTHTPMPSTVGRPPRSTVSFAADVGTTGAFLAAELQEMSAAAAYTPALNGAETSASLSSSSARDAVLRAAGYDPSDPDAVRFAAGSPTAAAGASARASRPAVGSPSLQSPSVLDLVGIESF